MVVSKEAISVVLRRELDSNQNLVYFISKALVELEKCYQKIENAALALVIASRKLQNISSYIL